MRIRFLLLFCLAAATAACDDGLGPQPWNDTPTVVTLYSASRADLLGFPSAFDFVNLTTVELERPGIAGSWDVALGTQGADLVLIPAGAFEGQSSRAGIATIQGETFASLTEAPSDTSRYSSQPVVIRAGGVYVVRTRRYTCSFSTAVNYAKIEVVSLNVAGGFATLSVVRNPYCNDRSFVPPEED